MSLNENLIAELVKRKVITDTFRRLAPDKKERVYQKALELFGQYGYDGLPVDRFCREAGISKGSFFQYFPSKSHLLEFSLLVFDGYLSDWLEEVRREEQAVMARDRLIYLYHAIVLNTNLFKSERVFYLFATNALSHAGVVVEGVDPERHIRSYISEIIRRGVQTGEIRVDFEPEMTEHLVTLVMSALIAREYKPAKTTGHGIEEYLISFLFDGIKA
jgi:AcrR family transcriptional regulator